MSSAPRAPSAPSAMHYGFYVLPVKNEEKKKGKERKCEIFSCSPVTITSYMYLRVVCSTEWERGGSDGDGNGKRRRGVPTWSTTGESAKMLQPSTRDCVINRVINRELKFDGTHQRFRAASEQGRERVINTSAVACASAWASARTADLPRRADTPAVPQRGRDEV